VPQLGVGHVDPFDVDMRGQRRSARGGGCSSRKGRSDDGRDNQKSATDDERRVEQEDGKILSCGD
jgi:hypothetical protein